MFEGIIADEDLTTISELCEKHRKRAAPPEDPRKKQLCALLRIADALDKTKSRARRNDEGMTASQVIEECRRQNNLESIRHWEGQMAIESIRLHLISEHIIFEFLVTDREKAKFIINDFKEELAPLDTIIPPWEIRITDVPRCEGDIL